MKNFFRFLVGFTASIPIFIALLFPIIFFYIMIGCIGIIFIGFMILIGDIILEGLGYD